MSRARAADLALVVTIGLFWGLNWPAVKFILGDLPPWTLRAIGLGCGTLILAALACLRGESLVPARGERLRLVVAGILTILGFNIFAAFGQLLTETSKAAIIAFTMPMWTALFSVLFLAEKLNAWRLASLCCGMLGLGVLIYDDFGAFLEAPLGPLIMLCAAISWAAGTIVLKSRQWTIAPVARTAWMMGCSALPAAIAALALEQPWRLDPPSSAVMLTLLYHIVFPMVVCHAAWITLVGRLPASVAAIGTLLVPIVGVLSASLLLGDPLTWEKLTALVLVLASIALTLSGPGMRTSEARGR